MEEINDDNFFEVDSQNYIKDLEDFPYQIVDAYDSAASSKPAEKAYDKIVVCGMGGSGIPGDILKIFIKKSKIPVFINKNYTLPGYVDKKTLVFTLSYSGNTEETIESFRDAMRIGAEIVAISSGGKLKELANNHGKTFVQIPPKRQPRAMVGYLFFTMLRVLVNAHLLTDYKKEITSLSEFLKSGVFKEKGRELAKKFT